MDFGCLDNNLRIIDLATFLSLTCFNVNDGTRNKEIYNFVLNQFQKVIRLKEVEKNYLPLFIKATYTSLIVGCSFSLKAKIYKNLLLENWLELGRKGLNNLLLA